MSQLKTIKEKANIIALVVAVVVIVLPIVLSLFGSVFAGGGAVPEGQKFLVIPVSAGQECVRDTEYMRYHHWELLDEIRDKAVRERQRGELRVAKCRECHYNRDEFCNRCHDQVNLKPDCWGCHYYPDMPEDSSGGDHAVIKKPVPDLSARAN